MESHCLFCLKEIKDNSFEIEKTVYEKQVAFELLTSILSVAQEVVDMWNFSLESESLPFCINCSGSVLMLQELHAQRLAIEMKIMEWKEMRKRDIKISAKHLQYTCIVNSPRYDNFRQQVLTQERQMSTRRLGEISGLVIERNEDSILTEDALSSNIVINNHEMYEHVQKQEIALQFGSFQVEERIDHAVDFQRISDSRVSVGKTDSTDINELEKTPFSPPTWIDDPNGEGLMFGRVKVQIATKDSPWWSCKAENCTYKVKDKKYPKKAMMNHIKREHYAWWICQYCDKKFQTEGKLQKHTCILRISPQKRQEKQCKKCHGVFANMSLFVTHKTACNQSEDVMGSTRPAKSSFICNHCQKSLSSKAKLLQHYATHEPKELRERAHKVCEFCGKRYEEKSLLQHLRLVHKAGTPFFEYKCPVDGCKSKFVHASKLKRHSKIHNKPKAVTIKQQK